LFVVVPFFFCILQPPVLFLPLRCVSLSSLQIISMEDGKTEYTSQDFLALSNY
jgi:hypothetical protein